MSETLPQDDEANRRTLIEEKLLEGFTLSYRTRIPPLSTGYYHDETGRTMFRRIVPEEDYESSRKIDTSPLRENVHPDETWNEHDKFRSRLMNKFGYENIWIGPTLERDADGNLLPDDYVLIYVRPSGMLRNTERVIKPRVRK